MSNPSADKETILQGQKAIEGQLKPTEQLNQDGALGNMHDSVYQGRKENGKPILIIHAADNVILNSDGSKTDTTPDMIQRDQQIRPKPSDKNVKEQKKPYPEAQMSHDATGKLKHIDLLPNKDR